MVPEPSDDGESENEARFSRRKAIQMGLLTVGTAGLAGCNSGGSGDGTTEPPADTPTDAPTDAPTEPPTGTPTGVPSTATVTLADGTPTDTPDDETPTDTPEPTNFETLTVPKGSVTPGEYSDLGDSLLSLSEFAIYEENGELGEGDVWAYWDEDNFYFAADVTDENYIINQGSAGGLWDNDCFQIALAPGMPGSTSNFSELTVADASTGEVTGPHLHHRTVPAGEDSMVLENAEVDVTRMDGERRTQYSFAVAWDDLAMDMSPEAGGDFSLSIGRHDPDDAGENWVNYGGGIFGGKEPFGLGTAVYGEGSTSEPEALTINKGSIDVDDISHLGSPTADVSNFTVYAGNQQEGKMWTRWDEDNFYFAAKVTNKVHHKDAEGSGNWDNDAIQIGIAPGKPGAAGGFDEINFSDTPNGPTLWHYDQGDGEGKGEITGIDQRVDHDSEAQETTYAYAVPWDKLNYDYSPSQDGDLSLTLVWHNREGEDNGGESWTNLGGGMLGGKEAFGLGLAKYGGPAPGDEEPFTGLVIDNGSIDVNDFSSLGEPSAQVSDFSVYEGEQQEGDMWVRWDADNFYLAADLKNDVFVKEYDDGGNWDNDSIQIGIAPGAPGEAGGFSEINFSGSPTGPTLWHFDQGDGEANEQISGIDQRVEHFPDEGRTEFAYAVPWSELAYEFSPEAGKQLSATLVWHNREGEDGGEHWTNLGGGMLGGKEPFGLGIAMFGE
jgi:hypothetical protein